MADVRRRCGRQKRPKRCAEMRRQSGSIRLNPAWEQSTNGTDYTDCASGVIGFHPTQSDPIRPDPTQAGRIRLGNNPRMARITRIVRAGVIGFHPTQSDPIRPKPGKSDRMKSIIETSAKVVGQTVAAVYVRRIGWILRSFGGHRPPLQGFCKGLIIECNCTMIEAARWIATSGREGRRQEKDARLNNETLASSTMLSLLNGYRARRSRSTSRSTSLPGCFRRFAERRIAALDERFRLLTTSYMAGVGGYRLSASLAACPHDFAPGTPCPNPVAGNSSAGAKDVAKTKPNVGRVQDWKASFFSGNTNISIRPGVGCENTFLRNEPK